MGGNVLIINGTLKSRVLNQEFRLSQYVSVDSCNPFGCLDLNSFPRFYYPLSEDTEGWYFKIQSNLSNPIVLKPGQKIDYEFRLYPLKAGVYHIHSFFISQDGDDAVGPGQTVIVSGSTVPTIGEVTQLYIPLAIGTILMVLLVLRARKTSKEMGFGRIRTGIKIYFAAKCSIESVWLAGLLIWLVMVAYPVLYPFESRLESVIIVTTIIAFIIAGSFFAAVSKSQKYQNILTIGISAASAIFYFILLFDPAFQYRSAAGAFGYFRNPFQINALFLLIAIITNAAVVVLALWKRKESYREGRPFSELASKQ